MTRRHRHLLLLPVAAALFVAACTSSGSDEAERDPVAFCDSLTELADLDDQTNQLQFDLMAEAVDNLEDARAVAPLEIETEVGVVADYLQEVVGGYADMEADEINNDPGAPFRALDDRRDRVETAGAMLETYAIDECDLDLRAVAPIEVSTITTPDNPEDHPDTTSTAPEPPGDDPEEHPDTTSTGPDPPAADAADPGH